MQLLTKFFVEEYDAELALNENSITRHLRSIVSNIAFERDIICNPKRNKEAREIIQDELSNYCTNVSLQGLCDNVVAGWSPARDGTLVIGAHYDGPPGSPGADDNGSAIAVLCGLARLLNHIQPKNTHLVAFNGEEHGMLGSREYVDFVKPKAGIILEMVGYFTNDEDTQEMPPGLPSYSRGDFLGIVGNQHSENLGSNLLKIAKKNNLQLPVKSIKVPWGLEDKLPGLDNIKRSDHLPFWNYEIPAVMITDTAEFRNKNYHTKSDTPDTLNYPAMGQVVELLLGYVLEHEKAYE